MSDSTTTDSKTMVRISIALGDVTYLLAQSEDHEALKRQIETAVRAGGAFVDFVEVGNRTVSALITGSERVILTVETVPFDERDTGDVDYPFGAFFDEI
ncbi:hypothetical protein ACFXP7_09200 [Microbacterium sp. P06]|uniref:hypothetical protein n=1 Tax=unclassified Microbacterium TaxID=2609290 RepID=UPI0037470D02